MKIPATIKCPYCDRTIETKDVKLRTTAENKYYWSVPVEILSDELGLGKIEVHEILKNKFLKKIHFIKKKDGNTMPVEIVDSTASLTTEEFEQFLRDVRTWSSLELGCFIPLPNEELKEL